MSRRETTHGQQLFEGTARGFAAEALLVPVGILTAAFLSRRFGPDGYGLLTLVSVVVVLVESNVAAALSRPAIKAVCEAGDWRAVGSNVLRLYLLAGVGLMMLLWTSAAPLAALLGEPALTSYLRIFALDVPVFCLAQAHRSIILGLGRYRERAYATVARWVARLVLVVLFVELGGTLVAAIYGSICASLVELLVCRLYVRPRLFGRGDYPLRQLSGDALPLVLSALLMSLYQRLDLLLLKSLGATVAEAGFYAIAQNLSLLPTLLTFSLAPALLSTLSRALRDGDDMAARAIARQAMRAVVLLSPLAALMAGAAPEIVGLIFGPQFLDAAVLLRPLIFGALALVLVAVTTTIMAAAGRPRWTLHVAWPLALSACAGHLLLIPRAGAAGAAWVTTACACAGALVTVALVGRLWHTLPPARTLARTALVSLLAYALAALIPSPGLLLVLKLPVACACVVVALVLLGEFSESELGGARALLMRRSVEPAREVINVTGATGTTGGAT
jgi:O-antigen/teichoic acid export membrane protein